jgi:hypothetical protein
MVTRISPNEVHFANEDEVIIEALYAYLRDDWGFRHYQAISYLLCLRDKPELLDDEYRKYLRQDYDPPPAA